MSTSYTSLLGLALPATGELSGTWGDTVNTSITSLLDSAIAGTTTLSSDADVTLTTTTGSANTAREAILLWTAGGTATRTITAPAQSKIYTVINASSGTQSIILAGAGPTSGVTIAKGESALCAWNGSDFIKISNTAGPGTFTNLTVTGNTTLGDADTDTITQTASYVTGTQLKSAKTATNTLSLAAYDVDGTAYANLITLTASNTPTLALTSTGVGTINNMSIGATTTSTGAFTSLTASTTLGVTGVSTLTGGAVIEGMTVGKGAGAVASNTAVGVSAIAATASGGGNAAFGYTALNANTSGSTNTALGGNTLLVNKTGSSNTAVGSQALQANDASNNTAVGYQAGYNNTTGTNNLYMGFTSGFYQQTGGNNTAVGYQAFQGNSTPANNTGVSNSAFGKNALLVNSSGNYNTAIGQDSLQANTTASNNTAVGYQAGHGANGTNYSIFIGPASGYGVAGAVTGTGNTVIGPSAGASLTSGTYNTFVGPNGQINQGTGGLITIGSKNTILGGYNGNQNSLNIITASKYVVLSDGDGVPYFVSNNSGQDSFLPGASPLYVASDTFASNLHIGNNVALMSYGVAGNRQLQLASNLYYYNGGYRYKTSNGASKLSVGTLGGWEFSGAVAGIADAVAVMVSTLGSDGNGYTVYLQGGAISQTGTGITFPATQNASSNANTLDDYEEGTTTVTFTPSTSGTITLNASYQTIAYTKVGRVVTITGEFAVSSVSTPIGTSVNIGNLPFAASGDSNAFASGFGILDLGTGGVVGARVEVSTNTINLRVNASTIGANYNIVVGFSYLT